ncbi:MAG: malto-oligosyltrehalose synthase [Steroidobacteraceae bacterium]
MTHISDTPQRASGATLRHAPRATYRVQLVQGFGFTELEQAVPYLDALGISHLYLSPVFRSRPGSQHGYDVTDHTSLNPELGTREAFRSLAAACRNRGMGLVLDIVPNHMAVMSPDNLWWMDVLENGPASRYADYFDIDWTPARAAMKNRLLVPFLGSPLGEVLEARELSIVFDSAAGSFRVRYAEHELPLDPRSTAFILGNQVGPPFAGEAAAGEALEALIHSFAALPGTQVSSPEMTSRRSQEQETCKRRLAQLCSQYPSVAAYVHARVQLVNEASDSEGVLLLARVLEAQAYRLAYWRIAGEEINYRRFFDVNELAALRMENPAVFRHAHGLLLELWREGSIQGVRVDHADGLYAPAQYLQQLEELLGEDPDGKRPYIVVEKILEQSEQLPEDWPVDGTTGYEFGALVTGWLMNAAASQELERIHGRFVGPGPGYGEIVYASKKRVMQTSLASEISMLAIRLDRIAQMSHSTTDFTLFDLRQAIAEYIACFPVYRTYATSAQVSDHDAGLIRRALGAASGRRQTLRRTLEFLGSVLLGESGGTAALQAAARDFRSRIQQVTGPVMAKGVEDTSFYRYTALLPMNEVGGDPQCRGVSTERLHKANAQRGSAFPRTLLATSTHDSKRGEDVRYRLCVLGEMVEPWRQCLGRWRRLKRRGRAATLPAPELEYLLLQTALGVWPGAQLPRDQEQLSSRLAEYAVKAAREAKDITSWLDPDAEYENLLGRYAQVLVPSAGDTGFASYFAPLLEPVAYFGMLNALAATAIKLTAPGIPDIYQGNELPRLVLVDPDNRGIVDLAANASRLEHINARAAAAPTRIAGELLDQWADGSIKMFVTARLLALRRLQPETFLSGRYAPLPATGERAEHALGYSRSGPQGSVLVLVSRWTATLCAGRIEPPLGRATWGDTRVELPADLPPGTYVDVLTERRVNVPAECGVPRYLEVCDQFAALPLSVLRWEGPGPS